MDILEIFFFQFRNNATGLNTFLQKESEMKREPYFEVILSLKSLQSL